MEQHFWAENNFIRCSVNICAMHHSYSLAITQWARLKTPMSIIASLFTKVVSNKYTFFPLLLHTKWQVVTTCVFDFGSLMFLNMKICENLHWRFWRSQCIWWLPSTQGGCQYPASTHRCRNSLKNSGYSGNKNNCKNVPCN